MHGLCQPFRRWHQLSGTQSKNPLWSKGGVIQFKLDDIPEVMMIANRPYACRVGGIQLRFYGNLVNNSLIQDDELFQEDFTPSLINNVQVDGIAMGTVISSNFALGGILDVNEYIASGLRFMSAKMPATVFPMASAGPILTPVPIDQSVFLPFGMGLQVEAHHTFPITCLINEGLLTINCGQNFYIDGAVDSLGDFGPDLSGGATFPNAIRVTASALVYPADEIIIAPGYQLTRFKSTAQSGPDTISLNSFGANSGFVGVQRKAGIFALLWASNRLRGPAAGSGVTASITDYSNDYFGVRQTNDIQTIKADLYAEESGDNPIETSQAATVSAFTRAPFFDTHPANNSLAATMQNPNFFPIVPPVRGTKVTKLVEATGNPSYNMTGVFGADHYTYLWGCYAWTPEKGQALIDRVKKSGVGMALYKSNDLIPVLKTSKKQDPQEINYSKRAYMPNKLLPASIVASDATVAK